ncbi:MAG: hypothetical protein ABJF23_16745 [Bryobacteraceae bacterium]
MPRRNCAFLLVFLLVSSLASAQSTGATFGDVIRLGGSPSDVVLDEMRGNLYLLNSAANRVDIYDYIGKKISGSISVGTLPVAGAMSMNGDFLYVSNNSSSSLSVIDLRSNSVTTTVLLTAKPEGVAVGNDGRVLISTQGTSSTDQINSLLIFDPTQTQSQQLTPVAFAPPPPTPAPVSPVVLPRPQTTFRGKLLRTADGAFIIGLSTINNNASTVLFVYETASGSILRSRIVTGQSTVLSISPDGSRFMAGFTLYETATLAVIAQQSTANVPFPLSTLANPTFSTLQNVGGSTFSGDGETIYSAFNVAPFSIPATRAQASTLLISNSHHLRANLGIKIPESLIARMVITSDDSEAWGISESGLLHLPLAHLYDYPILQPQTTAVFLAVDDCHRGVARFSVPVTNLGKGKLTYSVPDATAALIAQSTGGVVPSTINFAMEPGRTNVTRQFGTNLYSGGGVTNTGTPLLINISSPEAINVPNTIQVYMNVRQPDQRGVIYPRVTTTTRAEGLQDILVDEARGLVYLSNSGYNRIEVFDKVKQAFVNPIEVGQLPHQMAFGPDGDTLYVANTGGESISIVDLISQQVTGSVRFPPIPRSGASTPISPQAIANGLFGLQIIKSDGSQWKVVNGEATVRPANSVTPAQLVTAGSVPKMIASQDGQSIIAVSGNGTAYLYSGLADTFTISNRPYSQAVIQGYFGPLAAAADGSYLLENGFIMNSALALIGGSETPSSTPAGPLSAIRNVAAVAPVDVNTFVRITTPVKAAITSTPSGDARPLLEVLDFRNNSISVVGPIAENPVFSAFGTPRVNVPPRQIQVDAGGTAYAITLSGLTVIPMTPGGASRPLLAAANSIVNSSDGSRNIRPGSFVQLNGTNLATPGTADQLPAPIVLGGSCVTFSDTAIPLLQTAGGQISAQVPPDLPSGSYVVQVRSLATGQQSDPTVFTVQKP